MNFVSELAKSLDPQKLTVEEENKIKLRTEKPNITSTRVPFGVHNHHLIIDQGIQEAIDEISITEDHFRSSNQLTVLLNEIVSNVSLFQCWGKQSVKVRLNAFVNLLVSQLCVPHILSLFGVGLSLLSTRTVIDDDKSSNSDNFVVKAKRVLVEAFTLFKLSEELILDNGDDSILDSRRFRLFILLMELKCSSFLPHAMTIREHGRDALEALSCHILSVSVVTSSVVDSIKMVIVRMSNVLSGETTRSTIQESMPALEAIVVDYFVWLRQNFDQLVKLCRREEIVTSVDKSVRAWLRAETYASPIEILSVYNQKYKKHLTHMPIPLQPYRSWDIEQAKKDLVREHLLLNNIEYIGGMSIGSGQQIGVHVAIKAELRKVLAYLFEIDTFQAADEGNSDNCSDTTDIESVTSTSATGVTLNSKVTEASIFSSQASVPPPPSSSSGGLSPSYSPHLLNRKIITGAPYSMESELLDVLYSYTVLAASRTFASGDAFLILNDLYGGPGLTLCPTSTPKIRSRSPSVPSTPVRPRNGSAAVTPSSSSSSSSSSAQHHLHQQQALQAQLHQQMNVQLQVQKTKCDAVLAITTSGVKVTLKERYGLFIAAQMDDCSNIDLLQPLIRFECVTTTLLLLTERAEGPKFVVTTDAVAEKREECAQLFQALISNPEQICHRAVTIEPYL